MHIKKSLFSLAPLRANKQIRKPAAMLRDNVRIPFRRSSGESGGRLSRLSGSPEPAVPSRLPKKAKPEKKKIKKEILSLELVSWLSNQCC
jgi:hypothetical protein